MLISVNNNSFLVVLVAFYVLVGHMLSYAVLGVSVKPEVAWSGAGWCAATGRKQPEGYVDKMLMANHSVMM